MNKLQNPFIVLGNEPLPNRYLYHIVSTKQTYADLHHFY